MKKFIFLFVFASSIFLAHFAFSGMAVYGDGIDYWSYLPTVYFDRDVDFENQFKHVHNPQNNNLTIPALAPEVMKTRITDIGKTDNMHPPGTAIIWFPAFLIADFISLILNLPRNGYANVYQVFVGLWTIVVTIFGVFINWLVVKKITKDSFVSTLAAMGMFLASPLLYYGSYDILNSHFASFTLASILWYLVLCRVINWKNTLLIGLVSGFLLLVRLQEIILLIPAVFYLLLKHKQKIIPNLLIIFFVITVMFVPMFFLWQNLYGYPWPESYTKFWNVKLYWGSLFHPTNGLFSRTPLLLIAFTGLKKFREENKLIFWLMFLVFLFQLILLTAHGGWSAAAYGGRMYISSLPFFAVMLGFTLKAIKAKWGSKFALCLMVFFAVLNMVSIMSFVFFEKEVNSGEKRGLEEHTELKLERMLKLGE